MNSDQRLLNFPLPAAGPLDCPADYRRLRKEEPVARAALPSGDLAWIITRYDDIRVVCTDDRFSKAALTRPGAPRALAITRGSKSIFSMDPPEHSRLRRLIARVFTARRMESLRPRVEQIATDLVRSMSAAGPPSDLVAALARPLPVMTICEVLGVPYADAPLFRSWTDVLLSVTAVDADRVLQARRDLHGYLTELLAAKQRRPTDDLLGALAALRADGDALSEEELLSLAHTLLVAGYHATAGQIVFSVLTLLRTPGGLAGYKDDPVRLATAVEELLRYSAIGESAGMVRIATADVELGGVVIREGDAVIPVLSSGNRDSAVFEEPEQLRLERSHNPHIAFGIGVHRCLGAPLGRIELQAALGALADCFPALELAVEFTELNWPAGMAFRIPESVPVAW